MTLESNEDSAVLDVKQYYLGAREAEKRMRSTKISVRKAEEDYFIAEAKYQAGEGILLDVIDAAMALFAFLIFARYLKVLSPNTVLRNWMTLSVTWLRCKNAWKSYRQILPVIGCKCWSFKKPKMLTHNSLASSVVN